MVLELFIIWVGPGQASSAVVLVEMVCPLPYIELCPISVPNTVGAPAGPTLIAFVVVAIFELFVKAVEDGWKLVSLLLLSVLEICSMDGPKVARVALGGMSAQATSPGSRLKPKTNKSGIIITDLMLTVKLQRRLCERLHE
jgi:hypothetical protein